MLLRIASICDILCIFLIGSMLDINMITYTIKIATSITKIGIFIYKSIVLSIKYNGLRWFIFNIKKSCCPVDTLAISLFTTSIINLEIPRLSTSPIGILITPSIIASFFSILLLCSLFVPIDERIPNSLILSQYVILKAVYITIIDEIVIIPIQAMPNYEYGFCKFCSCFWHAFIK